MLTPNETQLVGGLARTLALAPGGRLVSVVAAGPKQRAAFASSATRWLDLTAGSFKSEGTGVAAAVVVFDL